MASSSSAPPGSNWANCWSPNRNAGPTWSRRPASRLTDGLQGAFQAWQHPPGSGRTGLHDMFALHTAQFGQHLGDARDLTRFVSDRRLSGPAQPGRGNVGRVGFQYQGFHGQLHCQPPDLQGALEGHGAAKTQSKSQVDELPGLLETAIEGVRDTAQGSSRPQVLQHNILRTP